MSTKSKHTETPWTVNAMPGHFFELKNDEGEIVLRVRSGMMPSHTDAAFIVQAVNAHAELVAFARAVAETEVTCKVPADCDRALSKLALNAAVILAKLNTSTEGE